MQEQVQQIPCHRLKRILLNFQQSAEHSLSGPTLVADNARHAADEARRKTPAKTGTTVSAPLVVIVPNKSGNVNSMEAAGDSRRSSDVFSPSQLFKRPVVPDLNRPLFMVADGGDSCELFETKLQGETIACFHIGGENRLCLPQVLNKVLFNIFEVKNDKRINEVSDALHIYFAECSRAQLDALKSKSIIPASISRCGLVLQTDAERLCAAFMQDCLTHRTTRPDGVYIPVAHECFGGCRGKVWPDEYVLPTSWCVECAECCGCMSPVEFVAHSHGGHEDRTCHWGFDSQKWRSYMMLTEDAARVGNIATMQKHLDDLKLRFVGKDQPSQVQHKKELIGAKRSRIELSRESSAVDQHPTESTNDNWKPVDIGQTWAACLNAVKTLQNVPANSRNMQVPPYLYTESMPVLENPEAVIPFEDACRYDRNFAPNVTLSTAPFDELNKLREPEDTGDEIDVVDHTGDTAATLPWRRRSTHSSDFKAEDLDDDEDTESVSSDKLEPSEENVPEPDDSIADDQLRTTLQSQMELIRAAIIASPHDDVSKQRLVERFVELQKQQMNVLKSLQWSQLAMGQELDGMWSTHETRRREAEEAKHDDDARLAKLRHDDAAMMREAALERHKLLQQIEELSNASNMSDQAMMAAKYKQEAELWKRRLEESEATNRHLRQELVALRSSIPRHVVVDGWPSVVARPTYIMSPVIRTGNNGEIWYDATSVTTPDSDEVK